MLIKKRNKVKDIEQSIYSKDADLSIVNIPSSFKQVISTGSTLLDLIISGKRVRGGGIPPGILIEIFGPSGAGKTALLSSILSYVQEQGGKVRVRDPEARLDEEYATIYGMNMKDKFTDYSRPDTVSDIFTDFHKWKIDGSEVINAFGCDSIAALSTEVEMADKDKRGQLRAKEFSSGLRKTCRKIKNSNSLVIFTNQVRDGDMGEVTPGGRGVPFYASLRIRIGPSKVSKIYRSKTIGGKERKKVIGILSECKIAKSSIDEPYRSCLVPIIFNYGIDDIRSNLLYVKDMTGKTIYDCFDTISFKSIDVAIKWIEEKGLEKKLKEEVIELWNNTEQEFVVKRKKKVR